MKNKNKLKITLMFLLGVVLTFLMINKTSAYSIPNRYNVNINEDYILNKLEGSFNNFSLDTTPYIFTNYEGGSSLLIFAFPTLSDKTFGGVCDNSNYTHNCRYGIQGNGNYLSLRVNISTDTISSFSNTLGLTGSSYIYSLYATENTGWGVNNSTLWYGISNFDYPNVSSSFNTSFNSWVFTPPSYTYNPSVLDTNVNFKKECINNQNTYFSVLPTDIDTLNTSTDFPINNYFISPYLLENFYINFLSFSSNDTSYNISDNNFTSMYYKFNTYDSVHDFSSLSSNVFNDFNTLYPSLYQSLYGYTLFNTYINYISSTGYFTTQVYHLSSAYSSLPLCSTVGGSTVCITNNGTIHGGGGRDHDTIIESPTQNTCFYIPIDYEIKIWDINDFNDINDNINIGGTDYNIITTSYEEDYTNIMNNSSYSGFIGYFNHILNVATIPITFISSKFSRLFNGMPIDIQYLVIGVLSLGFIIGIVKFLTGGK